MIGRNIACVLRKSQLPGGPPQAPTKLLTKPLRLAPPPLPLPPQTIMKRPVLARSLRHARVRLIGCRLRRKQSVRNGGRSWTSFFIPSSDVCRCLLFFSRYAHSPQFPQFSFFSIQGFCSAYPGGVDGSFPIFGSLVSGYSLRAVFWREIFETNPRLWFRSGTYHTWKKKDAENENKAFNCSGLDVIND